MTMFLPLALMHHSHPLIRALAFLFIMGSLVALFTALFVARYRRHAEMTHRIKTLEEKIDRLANPPTGK